MAALDHLFTDTIYKSMTSVKARNNPSVLKDVLNFESVFKSGDTSRVFPVLARYDQYIIYERQKSVYDKNNIVSFSKGHITGTMNTKALREHLLKAFDGGCAMA